MQLVVLYIAIFTFQTWLGALTCFEFNNVFACALKETTCEYIDLDYKYLVSYPDCQL